MVKTVTEEEIAAAQCAKKASLKKIAKEAFGKMTKKNLLKEQKKYYAELGKGKNPDSIVQHKAEISNCCMVGYTKDNITLTEDYRNFSFIGEDLNVAIAVEVANYCGGACSLDDTEGYIHGELFVRVDLSRKFGEKARSYHDDEIPAPKKETLMKHLLHTLVSH